jgi:hypothetical protein
MSTKNSRLEEMNRFRGALRHRLRCAEAVLERRLLFVSESSLLKKLYFERPDALLMLACRGSATNQQIPELSDEFVGVSIMQDAALTNAVRRFGPWDFHIQALIDPTDILSADLCHSILNQVVASKSYDLECCYRWGSRVLVLSDQGLVEDKVLAALENVSLPRIFRRSVEAYIRHAQAVCPSLTRVVFYSDGSVMTLLCEGTGDFSSGGCLAAFETGLDTVPAHAIVLNRKARTTLQIAYMMPMTRVAGESCGPRAVFVVSAQLFADRDEKVPPLLKEAG